jgi:genome maintenance exonuclease 1
VLTERLLTLPKYEPEHHFNEANEREYVVPFGYAAGVTTILNGSSDTSKLEEWRESIGPARADAIRDLAAHRGTKHHSYIEDYLLHGTIPPFSFLYTPYWKSTASFLDYVEKPLLIEGAVWHPAGFAGTLDALVYMHEFTLPDGSAFLADSIQPTLCDWKTADSPPKPAKLYEYALQVAAYVAASNNLYGYLGVHVTRALIVVAVADAPPQIIVLDAEALRQYYLHFLARLQRFTHMRRGRQ